MSSNADVLLFTYSVVLVGAVTGAQMLYIGAIRNRAMKFGGAAIEPRRLQMAGWIFSVAGILAVAVMAAEILSGAAGTDVRAFIVATVVIPPAVAWFNGRNQNS